MSEWSSRQASAGLDTGFSMMIGGSIERLNPFLIVSYFEIYTPSLEHWELSQIADLGSEVERQTAPHFFVFTYLC